MFKITIEAESLSALGSLLATAAAQFSTTVPEDQPKPATRGRKAKETAADLEPSRPEPEATSAEDAALEASLKAPAEPMPETAKAVVDAGTGQPVSATGDEPVKMTMTDIRTAAGKLAAKDTTKLGEVLKKYGAGKLSEVPQDKLADFASDVLEALDGSSQLD